MKQRQSAGIVLWLRSLAFWAVFMLSTLLLSIVVILLFAFPFKIRYAPARFWGVLNIWWLAKTCRLHYEIEGLDQIAGLNSGIVLSKHQSTWETLALHLWFKPTAWVLKRELLKVPFFGWGLALSDPIAIDRKAGRKAVEQLVEQGRDRLQKNRWVIIFPEGTRIAAGKRGRYRIGGAALAAETGAPVVPVAHNAGEYWPRRGFVKHPGLVKVHVGPIIDPQGKSAQQIMDEAQQWIETEMANITTLSEHEHGNKL
jgi:1-acyl-sn-glycerol-3-phosphate acyltransferase